MAINVQFQNLPQANSEILKAFNSANSARALEAYQPLDAKQRKLEKLRALQALKQSSGSDSLANISLTTDSLAIALQKADGATLQAMLNLLSAKMIEQNKYSYINTDEDKQIDVRKKVQEKLKEHKEQSKQKQEDPKKDEKKKEDSAVDQLVNAAATYFKELRDSIIAKYEKVLDAVSLKNLKKAMDDGLNFIVHYTYEVPMESFKEYVVDPLREFTKNLTQRMEDITKNGIRTKPSKSFSQGEIRSMLQKSFKESQGKKLQSSVDKLETSMLLRKKVKSKKMLSGRDLRLALHT